MLRERLIVIEQNKVRKKMQLLMKPFQVSAVPDECFLIKRNQYKQVVLISLRRQIQQSYFMSRHYTFFVRCSNCENTVIRLQIIVSCLDSLTVQRQNRKQVTENITIHIPTSLTTMKSDISNGLQD